MFWSKKSKSNKYLKDLSEIDLEFYLSLSHLKDLSHNHRGTNIWMKLFLNIVLE